MNRNILSYPQYFKSLTKDEYTFTIHSSFEKSINLKYKNNMITLQHRDLIKTPASFCLDLSQN
jgi:hypothetical protein